MNNTRAARSLTTIVIILEVVSATLNIAGCEFLGPAAVRAGRTDYNAAMKTTDVEQLLLNTVRLRYNDKPYFLTIASVSATAEAGVTFGGNVKETGVEGALSYFERPTIVYIPLTGEDFVRQLLTPIDLNTLLLLRGAGFELDDILRVFVNRMNEQPNAAIAAGPSPEGVPKFRDFLAAVEALDELEDRGEILLAASQQKVSDELVVFIHPDAKASEEFRTLTRILRLDPEIERYRLRLGLTGGGGDEMVIETRSILSTMFYLGQGIKIPEPSRRVENVNVSLDKNAQTFDWDELYDNLISFRSSKEKPTDPYTSVRYGGYWYFIDNSDQESKETLTMLSIVLTLKAGGAPTKGPLLTLPVTGP